MNLLTTLSSRLLPYLSFKIQTLRSLDTLYIHFQGSIPFHTQQQVQMQYSGIMKCDVEWCGWSAPNHATWRH